MRKLTIALLTSGLCLSLAHDAQAADENGRVYYKEGFRVEAGDADLKLNFQLQPRYEFSDFDRDVDPDAENTSGVRVRRARLIATGNLLDKAWSYYLNNDFAARNGQSDLRYAWMQYNGEITKLRLGQFKVPYSRQNIVSSSAIWFADRSIPMEFFTADRDNGVMAHGDIGGGGHYYAGLFNGDTDGERDRRAPVDTKHNFAAALDFSTSEYGSRGQEGDLRKEDAQGFGATAGASLQYGEGSTSFGQLEGPDGEVVELEDDFDALQLNGDVGIRCHGLDVQGEVFFRSAEADDLDQDADQKGFYVQATQMLTKNWALGGRFGWVDPDEDDIDDITEYTVGLNYFIDGHRLKVQNQVTFINESPDSGEDTEELIYILQVSALI